MKTILKTCLLILFIQFTFTGLVKAQLTAIPIGGNKKASVTEQIGITEIAIHYNRPGVKKREGHIWGKLIPVGFVDQGFGSSKAAPWRAGANENTTIEFSTAVKIEGQDLPAGKYGFFVAYDQNECTLIFSKNSTSWGSFYYNADEDALRVKVKPIPTDKSVEWLKYEFADQTPTSATVQLQWEKLMIPFKIDVDVVKTQIASFQKELRTNKGFTWQSWNQAAQYCAQNKTNLDQALLWTDSATNIGFGGSQNFGAWSTKATVLDSLGRKTEAAEVMKKAMPFADMYQAYFYAYNLVTNKKPKDAFDVFKMNYDRHPDQFFTNMGMASAYSALGDYKKALTYVLKAKPQAPNKPNKDEVERNIKDLQGGKDMNN